MKKQLNKIFAVFFMCMALAPAVKAEAYGIEQTAQTKNSVTVKWETENDAAEYYVKIAEDSSGISTAQAITVPKTQTNYTFNNLKPGTEYYVNLEYKEITDSGMYTRSVGSEYIKTLPGKVTGVKQQKWWYYIEAVDITWDKQTAAEYEYEIRDNKNKVVEKNNSYGNNASCGIKNNKVYTATVRAYVEINGTKYYGDTSDKAYLFTQPMVNQNKTRVSGNKLKIYWDKVSGVTGYEVYVSTKEKKGYVKVKSLKSSKNSLTVSKLKKSRINPKKKYYVYIVAKKKVGKRTYTSGRHYTVSVKKSSVNLNWTFDK